MLTAYNEVHPKVTRNLPGTGACDFEIQSVEQSRPGCSLHQDASSWNDAPPGATPREKTGFRLCKPQHWILSPTHTRQVHPVPAHTGKNRRVIASKDYFRAETDNSLTHFRSGGSGWQNGAAERITKATGIAPKLPSQVGAWHHL